MIEDRVAAAPLNTAASADLTPPQRWARWTLASLAAVLLWDLAGGDLAVARWFGNANGFALQSQWFMVHIAHEGARDAAWLLAIALSAGIWWPWGPLRRLPRSRRVQMVVAALLALAAMSLLKRWSSTSCPWELNEFGGAVPYVSHWSWGRSDGGGGHCFPAGHASAGFAFLRGYFVFAHTDARTAGRWLVAALVAGALLGLAQQMRGAHFLSHTLWTAWLCWTCGWLCDLATTAWRQARRSPTTAPLR